jgi:hypothetical protein
MNTATAVVSAKRIDAPNPCMLFIAVVWDAAGRLAFERLQNRLARRGAGAAEVVPAHQGQAAAESLTQAGRDGRLP